MRKLLSYQIVISGKIQYFRTFYSEAYSLKEFCHFSMHVSAKRETQRNNHVMKDNSQLKVDRSRFPVGFKVTRFVSQLFNTTDVRQAWMDLQDFIVNIRILILITVMS